MFLLLATYKQPTTSFEAPYSSCPDFSFSQFIPTATRIIRIRYFSTFNTRGGQLQITSTFADNSSTFDCILANTSCFLDVGFLQSRKYFRDTFFSTEHGVILKNCSAKYLRTFRIFIFSSSSSRFDMSRKSLPPLVIE